MRRWIGLVAVLALCWPTLADAYDVSGQWVLRFGGAVKPSEGIVLRFCKLSAPTVCKETTVSANLTYTVSLETCIKYSVDQVFGGATTRVITSYEVPCPGSGGSGAPLTSTYLTRTNAAELTNERALTELSGDGILTRTGGNDLDIFAGATCTPPSVLQSFTGLPGGHTCVDVAAATIRSDVADIPVATCVAGAAGSALSIGTTNQPVPVCIGTNHIAGALEFVVGGGHRAFGHFTLPPNWQSATTWALQIQWDSTTAPVGSKTVNWQVNYACVSATDAVDPALATSTNAFFAVDASPGIRHVSTLSGLTLAGCAAGDLVQFRLLRGSVGADYNATARLVRLSRAITVTL